MQLINSSSQHRKQIHTYVYSCTWQKQQSGLVMSIKAMLRVHEFIVSPASRFFFFFFFFLVRGEEKKKTSGDFSQVSVGRWNAIT